MSGKALVVGGTGPTGVHIVEGLAGRGHEVTILHRGVHENPDLEQLRHIHADPHFAEPVLEALGDETFDVVIAAYGRLKVLSEVFAGRCERLVAIGGMAVYEGLLEPESRVPAGMRLAAAEDSPLADPERIAGERTAAFAQKLLDAERAVLEAHADGAYVASIVRYPLIYGPRSPVPCEWSIAKRVADGRRFLLLPDDGLSITARCFAANAAHCVLLAAESPAAGGEIFNCGDDELLSLRGWAELVLSALRAELDVVSVPTDLRWVAAHFLPWAAKTTPHAFVDWSKARRLLGYEPVVGVREALAQTVEWYRHNPIAEVPVPGTGDRFDYQTEDRVQGYLGEMRSSLDLVPSTDEATHVYAHPKAPGTGTDHRGR